MSNTVRAAIESGSADAIDLIVTYGSRPDQAERRRLASLGAKVGQGFTNLPMQTIRVPMNAIELLAQGDDIEMIAVDEPIQAASRSARKTARLPEPGSNKHFPVAGNVAVAVLDSGISDHADINLQQRLDCRVQTSAGSETYRDEFVARDWGGNDGSQSFSGAWSELGESNGPTSGDVRVDSDDARCASEGKCLRIGDDDSNLTGIGALRQLDLGQANTATLSFTHGHSGDSSSASVSLDVSPDGGNSWTSLQTFSVGGSQSPSAQSFDLTPYVAHNTQIRFIASGTTGDESSYAYFDDVEVSYDIAGSPCADAANAVGGTADGTFLDQFDVRAYNNSDGTLAWNSAWTEINEPNGSGPTGGPVQVSPGSGVNCVSGNCLRVGGTKPNNPDPGFGVYRDIDLGGADGATMSFSYRRGSYDGGNPTNGRLTLDASDDGGATWTTVETFYYDGLDNAQTEVSVDLSGFTTANARIRFQSRGPVDDIVFFIDDIKIETFAGLTDPDDPFGHGTHVAGILGGDGWSSAGNYPGVAPGAALHSLRVLGEDGQGSTSDVIAALDWILANAVDHNIRVVNLSNLVRPSTNLP